MRIRNRSEDLSKFCLERARNKEKVNDGWSASKQAVGRMLNNLCKIEKILST